MQRQSIFPQKMTPYPAFHALSEMRRRPLVER